MPEAGAQSTREVILGRIRSIVGDAQPAATIVGEWNELPRHYRAVTTLDCKTKVRLLVDRLQDYDAQVYLIAEDNIAVTVSEVMRSLGLEEALVPAGIASDWLPSDVRFVRDPGFTPHELDCFSAVMTTAALAIAETGTLVLQNLPGQGRRAATLVPDVHLCVLRVTDVVQTVPEAIGRLQATAELPTTFISGPSATADIEMTRIKGVHGPRFLHVLLVE